MAGHAARRAGLLGGVFAALVGNAAAAGPVTGKAKVIDGDTLVVGAVVVRLHGIDAPEMGQTCRDAEGVGYDCGAEARDRLSELADGRPVACRGETSDGYGRRLAVCATTDAPDLGAALVREGLAWAFVRYSDDYRALEREARQRPAGLWSGSAQPPWDYRARRWEVAVATAPDRCPIKGNINRQGERIYHAPWSPWYLKTKVSERQGERWFCSEAEAVAAGFRPPYWTR